MISNRNKTLLFFAPAPESDSDFRLARRVHKKNLKTLLIFLVPPPFYRTLTSITLT
jgi:hypothetical protein